MSHSRKLVVPAAMVIGLFVAAPTVIGLQDAVAGGRHHNKGWAAGNMPSGGTGAASKQGGGETGENGSNKNGGDGGGLQFGGDHDYGRRPGRGNEGRHEGEGSGGNRGDSSDGTGNDSNGGGFEFGGGGGGGSNSPNTITCVINGRVVAIRSLHDCYYGQEYVSHGESYFSGHGHYHHSHDLVGTDGSNGTGYGFDGYRQGGYGETHFVGSRAAVMQARRRSQEDYGEAGDYQYSHGYTVGYALEGGYGNGRGYVGSAGYSVSHHMRHRRNHVRRGCLHHGYSFGANGYGYNYNFGAVGGCGCGTYNPGYVIHYGPTISKDGGY